MNNIPDWHQSEFERLKKIANTSGGKYVSQIKASQKNLYRIANQIQNPLDNHAYASKSTIHQLNMAMRSPSLSRKNSYEIPAGGIKTLPSLSTLTFKQNKTAFKKTKQIMSTNSSLIAKIYASAASGQSFSKLANLNKNNELSKLLAKTQEQFIPNTYTAVTTSMFKQSKNTYQNSFAKQIQKMVRINLPVSVQLNKTYNALGLFGSNPLTTDQLFYAKQILGEQNVQKIFDDAEIDYPDDNQTLTSSDKESPSKITSIMESGKKEWSKLTHYYTSLPCAKQFLISQLIGYECSNIFQKITDIRGIVFLFSVIGLIIWGITSDQEPK